MVQPISSAQDEVYLLVILHNHFHYHYYLFYIRFLIFVVGCACHHQGRSTRKIGRGVARDLLLWVWGGRSGGESSSGRHGC